MVNKIVLFNLYLKAAKKNPHTFEERPQIYTNDKQSVELQFNALDTSSVELGGASATILLFMGNGSFFQKTDVVRQNNTFTYVMKSNETKHSGIAKVQLVVEMDGVEIASPLYEIRVIGGLETKPIQEVEIQDWTTLTAEAKAFVEQIEGFTLEQFVENKMGEELANLEVNYATRLTGLETNDANLTAQLAHAGHLVTKTNVKESGTSSNFLSIDKKETSQPLVTFIDDDGKSSVWARLKPIFESKGVPLTLAIVSDWVDTPGHLTTKQILELQNDLGWEVASHEKTHIGLASVTDAAVINREIIQSKEELLSKGFNVKNIVYPFGQYNETVVNEVLKHYRVGVSTNGSTTAPETNNKLTNRAILNRTAFGSYAGTRNQLSHYKEAVDKAKAENSWLIFMVHVAAQDITQDVHLADTLDYIESQGIRVVNLDEGLNVFGSRLNIPGVADVNRDGVLTIDPTSKIVSEKYTITIKDTLINTSAKADDVPFILANYTKNNIIHSKFSFANSTGLPKNTAGLLITHLEDSEKGYIRQVYQIYETDEFFTRTYKANSTWTAWVSSEAWKALAPKKKSVIVPFLTFVANETKLLDIDLTGIGTISTSSSIIATCRSSQVDNFSYNVRVSNTTTAKLRLTNLTSGTLYFDPVDWDFSVF